MRLAPLCALALLAPLCSAQVPKGFLLVVEEDSSTDYGLRYVDPANGLATTLGAARGVNLRLRGPTAVSFDQQDPERIQVLTGVSSSIDLRFLRVQGSEVAGLLATVPLQAIRLEVTPFGTLVTVATGSAPGLWLLTATGVSPLHRLPNMYEVTAHGSDAYGASYSVGQPSTIVATDLTTAQTRVLGSGYPTLRALLAGPGGSLVAGTESGQLLRIDTTSGSATVIATLGLGPIVAMAGETGGAQYLLVGNSDVHVWPGGVAPVYRGAGRIHDIAWGNVDHASLLFHGTACGRTGQPAGRFAYVNAPSLGNANFALAMVDGRPGAPAVLVLGGSRTRYQGAGLPLDLSFLAMPGCSLYTDVLATVPFSLNAAGGASVGLPIGATLFRGSRFDAQCFHLDTQANSLGLAASNGAEGIIR